MEAKNHQTALNYLFDYIYREEKINENLIKKLHGMLINGVRPDGNGRIGRLLMNAILLENNLAPAIIRQEQKQLYYAYLYKAQTKNDQSQLENFLCNAIINGLDILERKDIK